MEERQMRMVEAKEGSRRMRGRERRAWWLELAR